MTSLRCLVGIHAPFGWATKPGVFGAGRCARCHEAVGGIAIDGPKPRPMQPATPKSRIFWLRAVYETKRAAQR